MLCQCTQPKVASSTSSTLRHGPLVGSADEFGLVEAVDGFGEGVDAPIGQVLVCGGGWRWWWSVMTRW